MSTKRLSKKTHERLVKELGIGELCRRFSLEVNYSRGQINLYEEYIELDDDGRAIIDDSNNTVKSTFSITPLDFKEIQ